MKVILLKDVKGIGRSHEAVEATDGHALNYLIPGKFAIPATPVAMKEAELRRKKVSEQGSLDAALIAQSIASLADARVVITRKANEKGHLYDAVGENDIRAAVKDQTKIELPAGAIKPEKPIKELGVFDIPVSSGEAFGKFSITIEAES